jgi:hypothetical protein
LDLACLRYSLIDAPTSPLDVIAIGKRVKGRAEDRERERDRARAREDIGFLTGWIYQTDTLLL